MASGRWVAVVVLGFILGSAFWLIKSPAREEATGHPEVVVASSTGETGDDLRASEEKSGAPGSVEVAGAVESLVELDRDGGRAAAEAAQGAAIGRVVDSLGQPVAGATVSWTPARLLSETTPTALADLAGLVSSSFFATTDERGRFELEGLDCEAAGILWVTSSRGGAGHIWVQAGRWDGALEVALKPAEPIHVTVTGTDAERTAEVWASAWPSDFDGVRKPGSLGDAEALALFVRRVEVEDGRAELAGAAPVGGAEVGIGALRIQATDGVLSSLPMRAMAGSELELELVPSFDLDGVVRTPPGVAPTDVLISVTLTGPAREELAARLVPDAEGHFGPLRLPLLEGCESILVQGFADGMAPVAGLAQNPEAGGHARVVLDGEAGANLFVQFVDPKGAAVEGIQARLSWQGPLGYYRTSPGWGRSGPDGKLHLGGAPAGLAYVQYQHESYVDGWGGPFSCPTPEGKPPLVTVSPSGTITGVVTHEGEPVEDFRIQAWPPSQSAQSAQALELEMLGEGRFRAGELPLGPVNLIAAADGLAQSAIVVVTVSANDEAEVELQLPSPLVGTGWVTDETTGLGVPGAMVQPFLVSNGMAFGFHGEPEAADSNGHFEIAAFGEGLSSIGIHAEGFSEGLATASPDESGKLDFGKIALAPATYLEVTLEGPPSVDWTGFTAQGYGGFNFPASPVPSDGRVIVDTARRGQFYLSVTSPSGANSVSHWMLEGTGPWQRAMSVGALDELEVHLSPSLVGAAGSGWLQLEVTRPFDDQSTSAVGLDGETNLYHLAIPAEGDVTLQLGSQDRVLVTKIISSATRSIDLDLTDQGTSIRLVDSAGQPLPNLSVGAFAPATEGAPAWRKLLWEQTDEEGLASLGELQLDTVDIAVFGDGIYQSFPAIATGRETELVLAPAQDLLLEVTDGGAPLAGTTLWIFDADTGFFAITAHTDEAGRFQRANFQTKAILVHSPDPTIWPETHSLDLTKAGGHAKLEMRRRGDLSLTALDLLGNPAAGIEVFLQSGEDRDPVSSWIAQGLVEAVGGMTTDAAGHITISGLPRGSYIWSAGTSSGALEVLAGQVNKLELTVEK